MTKFTYLDNVLDARSQDQIKSKEITFIDTRNVLNTEIDKSTLVDFITKLTWGN